MTTPEKNQRNYSANSRDFSDEELEEAEGLYFIVEEEYAGLRLDQVLVGLFPEHSRSRIQGWITQRQVTVNGEETASKQKMWGGEEIWVNPQNHPTEREYLPQNISIQVVYEDNAFLIVNKPVGMVVHPGSGNWEGTLLNALLHYAPQLEGVPRAGIVHRLDKDTSGLMVVAKTVIAQTALVRQLQERSVTREYLALVWGELTQGGNVDAPIDRHPSNRIKMAVVQGGKPAITHFLVERQFPSCTLLRCKLETGRTHQIRVHMAHLKHPLVGDRTYIQGGQKCEPYLRELLNNFPRQALHATRLALLHPATGERMEWHIAMPEDMQQLLRDIQQKVKATQSVDP